MAAARRRRARGAAGRAQRLPRPEAAPALRASRLGQPRAPPSERSAAAMSSGASVNALQRLVEQLKLEAGVERIKVRRAGAPFPRGAETPALGGGGGRDGAGLGRARPGFAAPPRGAGARAGPNLTQPGRGAHVRPRGRRPGDAGRSPRGPERDPESQGGFFFSGVDSDSGADATRPVVRATRWWPGRGCGAMMESRGAGATE